MPSSSSSSLSTGPRAPHRVSVASTSGAVSSGLDVMGNPIQFYAGPYAGKVIQCVQKPDLGRNAIHVHSIPPPVVQIKMYEISNYGTASEHRREIDTDEIFLPGLICYAELYPYNPEYDNNPQMFQGAHPTSCPIQPSTAPRAPLARANEYPPTTLPRQPRSPLPSAAAVNADLHGEKHMNAVVVPDIFGSARRVMYFVFPELQVRSTGHYMLKYRAMHVDQSLERGPAGGRTPLLAECWGGVFAIYPSKTHPALRPSTDLTNHLSRCGSRLHSRQSARVGRPSAGKPHRPKAKRRWDGNGRGPGDDGQARADPLTPRSVISNPNPNAPVNNTVLPPGILARPPQPPPIKTSPTSASTSSATSPVVPQMGRQMVHQNGGVPGFAVLSPTIVTSKQANQASRGEKRSRSPSGSESTSGSRVAPPSAVLDAPTSTAYAKASSTTMSAAAAAAATTSQRHQSPPTAPYSLTPDDHRRLAMNALPPAASALGLAAARKSPTAATRPSTSPTTTTHVPSRPSTSPTMTTHSVPTIPPTPARSADEYRRIWAQRDNAPPQTTTVTVAVKMQSPEISPQLPFVQRSPKTQAGPPRLTQSPVRVETNGSVAASASVAAPSSAPTAPSQRSSGSPPSASSGAPPTAHQHPPHPPQHGYPPYPGYPPYGYPYPPPHGYYPYGYRTANGDAAVGAAGATFPAHPSHPHAYYPPPYGHGPPPPPPHPPHPPQIPGQSGSEQHATSGPPLSPPHVRRTHTHRILRTHSIPRPRRCSSPPPGHASTASTGSPSSRPAPGGSSTGGSGPPTPPWMHHRPGSGPPPASAPALASPYPGTNGKGGEQGGTMMPSGMPKLRTGAAVIWSNPPQR
ncbi:velvet factor-domain-containing protein [Auriculariales sp. MPI-PUGE-AT-0066]|nr:velvet factor-domain-containing protein [Auriculariales sp. MPI-PUGE-AT-0066]